MVPQDPLRPSGKSGESTKDWWGSFREEGAGWNLAASSEESAGIAGHEDFEFREELC
jgi:hypothetical protein